MSSVRRLEILEETRARDSSKRYSCLSMRRTCARRMSALTESSGSTIATRRPAAERKATGILRSARARRAWVLTCTDPRTDRLSMLASGISLTVLPSPVLHLQSHSPDAYSHSVFLCQNMDTVIPWWPDCPGFQLPGRGFRGWRLCPLVVDLVRQANGLQ